MTDEPKKERAIWPLLMARVRALPEGDMLAFELEGCGITIQKELARLRHELELADALSIANARTYCLDSPEVLKATVVGLERELVEVRAIGELERGVVSAAIDWDNEEEDTVEAALLLSAAVDSLVAARAATGEPKETA